MYISLWENYRGHPDNISFMQFSTKIDGFEQKDSQGFENSYNSYEQYPLEKFFIFTIYQNYTLALTIKSVKKKKLTPSISVTLIFEIYFELTTVFVLFIFLSYLLFIIHVHVHVKQNISFQIIISKL